MTLTYPALAQCGRLGNQLWQIAATIGMARARGEDVSFPPWDYQPYFNVPPDLFDNRPGTDAVSLATHLDPRARAYLQDYSLVAPAAAEVRAYFAPSAAARAVMDDQRWGWYRQLPRPRVALHVRRGDNVTHPEGYHPLRSVDYYRRALEELDDAGAVVVFSDDLEWCRDNLPAALARQLHFFEGGRSRPREYVDRQAYVEAPVEDWIDLAFQAEAERHVLSNSTYSWWGAFLSDDPSPLYPSNWFGWRIASYTDAALMFPSHWREIHDQTQGGLIKC